jgi:hypothetical protein
MHTVENLWLLRSQSPSIPIPEGRGFTEVLVTTRIVYGTTVQVEAALHASPVSRTSNTYRVERNNLTIRQHTRRMGRKSSTCEVRGGITDEANRLVGHF